MPSLLEDVKACWDKHLDTKTHIYKCYAPYRHDLIPLTGIAKILSHFKNVQ